MPLQLTMRKPLVLLGLVVMGCWASGCATWPQTQRADESDVDAELTTQRAVPRSTPTQDMHPRPGFAQDPEQAP